MPDGQANSESADIVITDNAAARIAKLIEMEGNESLKLRIAISGGGCSGFVYGFELDETIGDDDIFSDFRDLSRGLQFGLHTPCSASTL